MPAWIRGISIPAALLGLLGFFLPWVAVSCGPVRMTLSGYEIATGSYSEKLSSQGIDSFWNKTNDEVRRQAGSRPKRSSSKPVRAAVQAQERPQNAPVLWIVPLACLILALLAIVGLPRVPTIAVSVMATAYLAYFGVSSEQQLNDPRNTGGIVSHEWVSGYWLSWIGLLGPMFVAIFKPRDTLNDE